MTVAAALLLAGVVAAFVPVRHARRVVAGTAVLLGVAVVVDAAGVVDARVLADVVDSVWLLDLAGDDPTARLLLFAAVVWCGPGGDLVVRALLDRTGLPPPERAAEAGFRAGRWIGRLERWTLLVVVAAGQPALAVIPTGGKALLRYAEVVADARAARDRRLEVPDEPPRPGRDSFLDYVLVGSLASWAQALVLGLLVAAR